MKPIFKTTAIIFFIVTTLIACNDNFLNSTNPSSITAEEVWNDQALIEMYVNRLYNAFSGYDYDNLLSNITDEARDNYPGSVPNQILGGQWDQTNNPMGFWVYDEIRRANEFFARIDDAPVEDELKTNLKGEVRFIRSFLYFKMIKRYGGVPIIEKPQNLDDDLQVSRNTLDESFNFVIQELNMAMEELPADNPRGKASKGAATALKGRVLLFYASPLYNQQNDASRWERAAEANKAVMDMEKYALYPDLGTLWLDQSADHPETIFEIQYNRPEKEHSWDSGLKPLVIANNNAGHLSPLQELVDAFPMENGKSITDPASGYDPEHPYEGRADRFYDFIAFNGSKLHGTTSGPPVQEITLQIFDGGRDFNEVPDLQIYNTFTGYYTRKALDPDNAVYEGGSGSVQPWVEIRYAEVLLNYAEAKNESLGSPDASVYEAINKVRRRAGITQDLAEGSLNKAEMRDLIRNERYIELAFEKKRYWDIRRWMQAVPRLDGEQFTGVFITKQGEDEFSYEYQPVDEQPLVFKDYMYWMPIPRSEITKNENLEQNPGW